MIRKYRADFPLLDGKMNGKPLVYLDSAATAQKPQVVLEALDDFYRRYNANVHRGDYTLATQATEWYEAARSKVARFLGAPSADQVVFTRGATEALNLVAMGYAREVLMPGDEIVTTVAEHHSNLVPWQMVARWTGAKLKFLPFQADGTLSLDEAKSLITHRTKIVAISHISNVLGTIHPIKSLAKWAHDKGAVLVLDAAQSVPHLPVDVGDLDCDFLVFSGHKAYGPTGIGGLYAKRELLAAMEPMQFGGGMLDKVGLGKATWKEAPWKFEAGTPPIAEAVGLGIALDYLAEIGMERVHHAVREVTDYAYQKLAEIEGVALYGPAVRSGLVSFNLGTANAHDVAAILDSRGVAVRAGHHGCQPLTNWLCVDATVRASFGIYNTREDVDHLVEALTVAQEFLGRVPSNLSLGNGHWNTL